MKFFAALHFFKRKRPRPIPGPFTYEREARGLITKTQSKDRPR